MTKHKFVHLLLDLLILNLKALISEKVSKRIVLMRAARFAFFLNL